MLASYGNTNYLIHPSMRSFSTCIHVMAWALFELFLNFLTYFGFLYSLFPLNIKKSLSLNIFTPYNIPYKSILLIKKSTVATILQPSASLQAARYIVEKDFLSLSSSFSAERWVNCREQARDNIYICLIIYQCVYIQVQSCFSTAFLNFLLSLSSFLSMWSREVPESCGKIWPTSRTFLFIRAWNSLK